MGTRSFRRLAFLATSLLGLGIGASSAHAQAWVPDKGDLGLSLDYNFSTSDKVVTNNVLAGDVDTFENAGTTGHQLTLGAEYVPIPKLAITASLPFVALKYTGDKTLYSHPGGGSYDDGSFHSTLTDFRVGARYAILEDPVAIAPHIGVSIPVADYETVGNTVAGRHLKQLHLGASIGYLIGLATYVHGTYEFTLAEKYDRGTTGDTKKYSQNRSDFTFAIGHKLLDYKLDIHLGANYRKAHGGLNFSELLSAQWTNEEGLYHDAILKENVFLAGGGVGYDISNTLTVTADFRVFVEAFSQNTLNASVFALGVGWSPL